MTTDQIAKLATRAGNAQHQLAQLKRRLAEGRTVDPSELEAVAAVLEAVAAETRALRTYAIVAVALTAACAHLRADEHPDETIEDTARLVVDTALSEGWTSAQIEADPAAAVAAVRALWASLPSGGAS